MQQGEPGAPGNQGPAGPKVRASPPPPESEPAPRFPGVMA